METGEQSEKPGTNVAIPSLEPCILQWSQWQLLDSILPTGGFAHSLGLESSIQSHLISSPEDLQTFTIHLLHNTGSLLLPYVYTAATSPDTVTWHKLDKALDATLSNEIARKASVAQGAALMRVAAAVFADTAPSIKAMRESCLGGSCNFHHAPVFGMVCGLLGMDSATAQRGYMFITMRDVISAATRLNLVGPLGAAVLQHRIAPIVEEIVIKWMDRSVEDSCQINEELLYVQAQVEDSTYSIRNFSSIADSIAVLIFFLERPLLASAFRTRLRSVWTSCESPVPSPSASRFTKSGGAARGT